MSYDGPPLTEPQLRTFLSLYDLLTTELHDVLTPEQEAFFGFTRHELRAGHPVPNERVVHGLRILAQTAATHHRPDLSNKVRNALRDVRPDWMSGGDPGETDALYDGRPLSRPQRRTFLSLYDLATGRLRDVLTPDEAAMFVDLRHRLRSDLSVPDQLIVHLLMLLGKRAALHGHSDLVVKLYRAYLKMMPDQWSIWYDLGNHLTHISDHDVAIIAYDEALRHNPRHAWSRFNRGRLHYDLEHYDLEHYDDAVAEMWKVSLAAALEVCLVVEVGRVGDRSWTTA